MSALAEACRLWWSPGSGAQSRPLVPRHLRWARPRGDRGRPGPPRDRRLRLPCPLLVESPACKGLRSDQIESTFSIEGFECLRREVAEGRGVIVVLPHVGSWEYGGRWLAQQGYPMTTVGQALEPPELFEWFTSQRIALGPGCSLLVRGRPSASSTPCARDASSGSSRPGSCRQRRGGRFFGEKTTLPRRPGPARAAFRCRFGDLCHLSATTRAVPRRGPAPP